MTKPIDKPPSKETPADLRSRAEAALENGDLVAAKELAGRLSALPLGPWDNTVLGRIALADGDHPAARTALEAALKQLPDEGSILVHLAEVCAVQKRWGEAVKTITIAIAQRGSIAELHERRAIYLANTGDQIESIDALERALGLEPDRASAWALLGERYIEQKNSQAAKKAFETAVKSDPTNHSGLWNLAL
ncbi:MAG: tetratricopeptide repeat protein, partial [Rhodospirillaceae bacterium]|nr:tetratricopeptide repeat protein [Rhodospirillaceae bacterium]